MAEESIVIDVKVNTNEMQKQLSASIHAVAELKKERSFLTKEIEKGNDVDGAYALQLQEINKRMEMHQRKIKSTTALMQVEGKTRVETNMSLDEQRQILNTLQKAYANMSGEAKEMADEEGGLRDQIKQVNDMLKEQEHAIGDDRRNVGNYAESLADAAGKLGETKGLLDASAGAMEQFGSAGKTVGTAMKGISKVIDFASKSTASFAKAEKVATAAETANAAATTAQSTATKGATASQMSLNAAIAANPIGALITALTVAISLLAAFKDAEDDASEGAVHMRDAYDSAAETLSIVSRARALEVERMKLQGRTEEEIYQYNLDTYDMVAEENQRMIDRAFQRMHEAEQFTDEYYEWERKQTEADLAKQQAELDKKLYIQEVKRKKEEEKLAAEKQRLKEEEEARKEAERKREEARRKREAQEAASREIEQKAADLAVSLIQDETARKIAARKIQGEREIDELKRQLKKGENLTKESKDKLNQLIIDKEAALNQEIAEMADAAATERLEAEEEATREREERILNLKIEVSEEYSEEWLDLQKELLSRQLDYELEAVGVNEEEKFLIRQKYAKMVEELQKQVTEATKVDTVDMKGAYIDAYTSISNTAGSVFKSLKELADVDADTNEKNAEAKKRFAIAGILSDQAASIATGVKAMVSAIEGATNASAATGPAAPFTLPVFIAEMTGIVGGTIASAIAGIAEAKKVMAGKFEDGGIVPGTSYHGDHMVARVNSGEAIITREGQARLLELAENPMSAGSTEAMANIIASAVASLPAPVMAYSEFNDFTSRVATYNELAKI